jgi:hypothetical protein
MLDQRRLLYRERFHGEEAPFVWPLKACGISEGFPKISKCVNGVLPCVFFEHPVSFSLRFSP